MNTEEKINLFEAYVKSNLTEAEQAEFELQLKKDREISEEFDIYLQSLRAIEIAGLHQDIQLILQPQTTNTRLMPGKLVWVSLAASLLLAVLSIFVIRESNSVSSSDLFVRYYQPYPNIHSFRGAGDPKTGAWEAYSKREYQKSFYLLDKWTPKTDTILFYMAMCKLSLNEPDESIKLLSQIEKQSVFIEQANWYLAMAYLNDGNLNATRESLKRIRKGEFKFAESRKILDAIKK